VNEWQNYGAAAGLAASDTFLVRRLSVTPPSAGTVQQVTAAQVAAAAAVLSGAIITIQPSGDHTGVTDAATWNSAIASGKTIFASAIAEWYILGGQIKSTLASGISIYMFNCFVNLVGAGAAFDFTDTSDPDGRVTQAGGFYGFPVFDATNVTGASYAFHGGDIFLWRMEIQAQNFTFAGSGGIWYDNRNYWTEGLSGRIYTFNCVTAVIFDVSVGNTTNTGSFERAGTLEITVNQGNPNYDGVVFRNGAFIQDKGPLVLGGNFGTSIGALTSAAVRIEGQTPAGVAIPSFSNISNAELIWGCEVDTSSGSNAPYTVFFGTADNYIANCTGNIDFGAASAFQSSNSAGQFIGFIGVVQGDTNLPTWVPAGTTNIALGAQTIPASGAAVTITGLTLPVATFTAYRIRLDLPHTAAGATGTFTVALAGGPAINAASMDAKLYTGTSITSHTVAAAATLLSATPSATARDLEVDGTVVFNTTGDLTLTGEVTSGGSAVTIAAGAYLELAAFTAPS